MGLGKLAAGEGTATSVSVKGDGGELARTTWCPGAVLGSGGFVLGVIGRVLGTGGGLLTTAGGGAVIGLGAGAFVTAAFFASGGE